MKTKFDISHNAKQLSFYRQFARYGASPSSIRIFQNVILHYYRYRARSFPWRETRDWYPILVSEIMSQQTQVARVLPKYNAFLSKFPTPESLARAKSHEVIKAWQGLGYNRRGLGLQRCVREVLASFAGELPRSEELLLKLPGVGPYTAAALRAFVFNEEVVVVETNIRAVILYFFFSDRLKIQEQTVSENEIYELVELTQVKGNTRKWYSAMMDYGAMLKTAGFKSNHLVSGYKRQSQFKGSFRQVRGAVLRVLSREGALTEVALQASVKAEVKASAARTTEAIIALREEGFIFKQRSKYQLSD